MGGFIAMLVIFGGLAWVIYTDWYASRSHYYYDNIATLREDVKISYVNRESVGTRGRRRWRTTVLFTDGFKYVSHKTDIQNHFASYTISISVNTNDEILQDALMAHHKIISQKAPGI